MSNAALALPQTTQVVRPAGRECQLWNDEFLSRLRKQHGVPDTFLNTHWNMVTDLQDGGGKGGARMAFVKNSGEHRWVVKEVSPVDHETLLNITESYVEHVCGRDSLLSPIYLHFKDLISGRNFFAMRNQVGSGPFDAVFDLKACADDKTLHHMGQSVPAVHKRCWYLHLWLGTCFWSQARRTYWEGKRNARKVALDLSKRQREYVLNMVTRDTRWLAAHRLMDYSLLVARKTGPVGFFAADTFHRPFVNTRDGEDVALYIGIIDFLQVWTLKKNVARGVKCLECEKATIPPVPYSERFRTRFEKRLVALPDMSDDDDESLDFSNRRGSMDMDMNPIMSTPAAAKWF